MMIGPRNAESLIASLLDVVATCAHGRYGVDHVVVCGETMTVYVELVATEWETPRARRKIREDVRTWLAQETPAGVVVRVDLHPPVTPTR